MEEEQRPLSPTRWLRRLTSGIGWFLVRSLLAILVPVIQYAFIFLFMIILSIAGYGWINFTFVPKALISEPLYFDFSRSPPVARISLLSREKQWHYMSDCLPVDPQIHGATKRTDNFTLLNLDEDEKDRPKSFESDTIQECSGKDRKKFLRGGFRYSIDVMFGIASSPKNFQLGKFMVHAKVFDSAGSVVATSSRPVVMPHQSYVTLFLDALVKFPLRAVGVLKTAEVSNVLISVMNDFREPYEASSSSAHSTSLTTEHVELRLSSADVDFNYAIISVMPALSGITWFMYYNPGLSWILGVTLGTITQLIFVTLLVGVRLIGLAVLRDDEGEEDEEDEEEDAEGEAVAPTGQLRGLQQNAVPPQSPATNRAHPVQSGTTPIRVSVFTPRSPSEPARRESQGAGDGREEGLRRRVRVRQGTRSRSPPSSVV